MRNSNRTGQRVPRSQLPKLLGVSSTQVSKDVKAGYYSPGADGLFDLAEARKGRANRAASYPRGGNHGGGRPKKGTHPIAVVAEDIPPPIPSDESTITLAEAQRRWQYWKAEAARIDVEQKRGELVPMAVVCRTWSELVTTARGRLLLIPDRCPDPVLREQFRTDILEALAALAADEPPPIKKSK